MPNQQFHYKLIQQCHCLFLPEMRNLRTLYFRRSGSLGQSQQDNSRAQRLYRTYPRKYLSDKRHQGRPEHLLRRILFSVYGTQPAVAFFSGYDVHHTGASRYQSKAGRCQNDGGIHAAAYQNV